MEDLKEIQKKIPNWTSLNDDDKKISLEILYRNKMIRYHGSQPKGEIEIREGVDFEDRHYVCKRSSKKKFDER